MTLYEYTYRNRLESFGLSKQPRVGLVGSSIDGKTLTYYGKLTDAEVQEYDLVFIRTKEIDFEIR